jgi:hypothetical protein
MTCRCLSTGCTLSERAKNRPDSSAPGANHCAKERHTASRIATGPSADLDISNRSARADWAHRAKASAYQQIGDSSGGIAPPRGKGSQLSFLWAWYRTWKARGRPASRRTSSTVDVLALRHPSNGTVVTVARWQRKTPRQSGWQKR